MSNLTLGSLFDGSGGFPLGGMLAGIEPLWSSEIEPFPIMVTQKRLPWVKHYGNICNLNGADLEPVDVITFGSPCQDMSIAGKRDGLDGSRSCLFHEAIRIVKEMREATLGEKPRFIVWENVAGAFSSNKGEDFRCVIEEICRVKEDSISISPCPKWQQAGEVVGDDFSVCWRTFDAQYWGVPQRRKRIYLVADFAGRSASKVLFESEGLSGYSAESFRTWQRATSNAEDSTRESSKLRLMFENHSQDTRYVGPLEVAQTVLSTFGTGGNNQPFVVEQKNYDVRITSSGTKNVRAHVYETELVRCLDTGGQNPDSNHGGVAIVSIEEITSKPAYSSSKASFFTEVAEEKANTLVATDYKDPPIITRVDCPSAYGFYPQLKAECVTFTEETSGCLLNGTNPGYQNGVLDCSYVVRRLTPLECARLQGFPDWWCDGLETEEPSGEEIEKWRGIFEEYAKANDKSVKPKSDNQIIKWLKEPYTDSAAYKMWGNGVALPNVYFVLSGIAWISGDK